MPFDGLLYPLWLDANVSLCHSGGAVLQKPLDQGNIIAVVLVDLRRVPLAEAVRADALIAQVIADPRKDLLHFPCCNGEDQVGALDAVAQAVILYVLLDHERDREDALLARLLLHDRETEPSAVVHDIAGAELHDIADPQPQVAFQHESRCHPLIGTKEAAAFFHGSYNVLVLFCGQSRCFLVHFCLQVRICEAGKFAFLGGL